MNDDDDELKKTMRIVCDQLESHSRKQRIWEKIRDSLIVVILVVATVLIFTT